MSEGTVVIEVQALLSRVGDSPVIWFHATDAEKLHPLLGDDKDAFVVVAIRRSDEH